MSEQPRSEATSRVGDEDAADAKLARNDASPVGHDVRSIALTGIFILIIFYTLYAAAEIATPLVFAVLLKLLLQPAARALSRLGLAQPLAALAVIIALFAVIGTGGYLLAGPATAWAQRAPESLPRLEQHLRVFKRPIEQVQEATRQLEKMAPTPVGATRPSRSRDRASPNISSPARAAS